MVYPFTAIVAQDKMKLALVLNVINPLIGGVLIRGERGTGKSTAVRALAELLPEIQVVEGCKFNCDPCGPIEKMCSICQEKVQNNEICGIPKKMTVVEIPLSATEDKVVGSLDIEKAIRDGLKALEPGLLAAANRNILYVDEINLLSDHIIDDLLDCAAFGINLIEREGISLSHPSKFILVGSCNPEEGELRPQILDRLGLCIDISCLNDFNQRLQILRRVEEFDQDPEGFISKFDEKEQSLQKKILNALKIMNEGVKLSVYLMTVVIQMCILLKVPTHRGEITINRCAKALAAFDGRKEVNKADILTAAQLALAHRIAQQGLSQEDVEKLISDAFKKALAMAKEKMEQEEDGSKDSLDGNEEDGEKKKLDDQQGSQEEQAQQQGNEQTQAGADDFEINWQDAPSFDDAPEGDQEVNSDLVQGTEPGHDGYPFQKEDYQPKLDKSDNLADYIRYPDIVKVLDFGQKRFSKADRGPLLGKRLRKQGNINKGRYITYKIPKDKSKSIAFDATIRAAAPYQRQRTNSDLAIKLQLQDVREKVFEYQAPLSIVFVLDASGSMFRMLKQMKDVILNLHESAYKHRDRVGLVTFQGYDAIILQQPTVNLNLVLDRLSFVQSDSWTPLASGLIKGMEILKQEQNRNPDIIPVLVVLTDGGANVPISSIPPPPFHNFQYYKMLEDEIMQIAIELKNNDIYTVVLWPENAGMRGPRHKRIALSIAEQSEGVFYQIRQGAKLADIFSRSAFSSWRTRRPNQTPIRAGHFQK
ncbi:MAG: VWA domain-containing protein [Candidatus Helarchaeota archaeon]